MLTSDLTLDGTPIPTLTKGSTKKVQLTCDDCGKESETTWSNYVQYQRKRGWTGETFCQSCAAKKAGILRRGRPNPRTADRNRKQVGPAHPSWKGGRYVDHHGYVMVNVRSGRAEDGGSGWENYRKEHVLVMEEHLGRSLEQGEVVHHIDGDKTNNRISNLLLTNQPGHRNAHNSLQGVGFLLVRSGLICLNCDTGLYEMAPPLKAFLEKNNAST